MNTLRDLIALTRDFRSALIDTGGAWEDSVLVIDKAIGALTPTLEAPFGWLSANAYLNEQAGQWELGPPLDVLLSDWLVRHPGEYSGKKLALANFGIGRTTDNLITLEFRRTTWAQVRAFQEAVESGTQSTLTSPLLRYHIDFRDCPVPNIAVVHAVIVTSDGMLMSTQRSQHLQYHPGHWSFSFEEGLKESDFASGDDPMRTATLRGLREEVSGASQVNFTEFAILGVAMEFPILNPAIITIARVDQNSRTIQSLWTKHFEQQSKPEAVALTFSSLSLGGCSKLIADASGDNEPMHPTSRYRILLSMIHLFGLEETIASLRQSLEG